MRDRLDRIFTPLLAGAHWRDRLIASLGGLIGIGGTALVVAYVAGADTVALLVAPVGASAVLLFCVPSSPMAQPLPTVFGAIVSMFSGFVAAHLFGHGVVAAGVSVGLAILLMSVLRCLHPPGGGYALVPVVGGPAVLAHGWGFLIAPVGVNALLLVLVGLIFHRFSGHSYPHRAQPVARTTVSAEDIDAA
ncbi:MAG TPA: HPP family protein, partial [Sphingomonas sp.]|nr:HPP family protein [Sphingomonas sp.]